MYLRQSTIQTIRFGPFLDATDGVTEEIALTITQALRRISKDGGAFAQSGTAGNATHDSDGWYSANLSAADTNTVGELILNVQVPATHLPVWMRWWVIEEAIYDDLFGAAAVGYNKVVPPTVAQLNARTILSASYFDPAADAVANVTLVATTTAITNAVTVGTINANALNAAAIATNAFTAAKFAAASLNGKGDWNIGKTGYSLTQAFPTNFADLAIVVTSGLVSVGSLAANVITAASINAAALNGKGDWNIGKTGYSLTVAPLTAAQVNAQVDLALSDINLDHLVGTATGIPTIVSGTYIDQMQDDGTAVYDRTTDSLQALADTGGGGPTAAAIADAVWDELQSDHVTALTFGLIASEIADILIDTGVIGAAGAGLTAINLPDQTMNITGNITGNLSGSVGSVTGAVGSVTAAVTVGTINANVITAASINAAALTAAKFGSNYIVAGSIAAAALNGKGDWNIGKTGYSLTVTPPTAATIADAVLNEDMTAHQTLGSLGQAIGDPVSNTKTMYAAIVSDAAGASVAIDVVAIKAETVLILDDTDDIGVAGAGLTAINLPNQTMDITGNITGNVSGSVGSVTGAVGSVTAAVTVGTINANVINAASINAAALTAAKFGADFITAGSIADNAFLAVNFAAASLNGKGDWNIGKTGYSVNALAANTITAASINAAAFSAAKFGADFIVASSIATGGIDANALAADAISANSIAAAAVDKIRDGLLPTQNVAFPNIEFLFVAASDHVTPVTGATGTSVSRSIDGGAFGSGTGTLAEVANGIYQYDASAADMNGGIITFRFIGTGGTPGAPDDAFLTIITGGGV